jgi:hypothetical protein
MNETEDRRVLEEAESETDDSRQAYEPPRLTKKRSVSRVTLFSSTGAAGASTLTAA